MATSVTPEKTMLRHTREVQPGTVALRTFSANTLYIAYPSPQAATKKPKNTLNLRGNAEKDVIAVHANRSILITEYFVSPAALALRSYGRITSRSPSHATIPRIN